MVITLSPITPPLPGLLSAAWAGHGPAQGASRMRNIEEYWEAFRKRFKVIFFFQLCQSLPFAGQEQGWKKENKSQEAHS